MKLLSSRQQDLSSTDTSESKNQAEYFRQRLHSRANALDNELGVKKLAAKQKLQKRLRNKTIVHDVSPGDGDEVRGKDAPSGKHSVHGEFLRVNDISQDHPANDKEFQEVSDRDLIEAVGNVDDPGYDSFESDVNIDNIESDDNSFFDAEGSDD